MAQRVSVLSARDFRVLRNGKPGDGMGRALTLVPEDTYRIAPGARLRRAELVVDAEGRAALRRLSDTGVVRSRLRLDAVLTLISDEVGAVEVLLAAEVSPVSQALWIIPMAPLRPRATYSLAAVDPDGGPRAFAEMASAGFAKGTRLARPSGELVAVETLRQGDKVLTRDGGTQRIRWIGRTVQRAAGPFAPIRIAAGALSNERDLVVTPATRLFVYQRQDLLGAGRPETMVRAELLVNDTTVTRDTDGYAEFFQVMFEGHEIVYAEGVGCESLEPGPVARDLLPANLHVLLPRDARTAGLPSVELRARARERADLAERLMQAARG